MTHSQTEWLAALSAAIEDLGYQIEELDYYGRLTIAARDNRATRITFEGYPIDAAYMRSVLRPVPDHGRPTGNVPKPGCRCLLCRA